MLFLGFLPYLSYGFSNVLDIVLDSRAAWGGTSQFGLYGTGTTFLIFLHNFTISSALISGYFLILNRPSKLRQVLCLIVFALSIILVASSGTRTKIGLVLFPLVMSNIYVNRGKTSFYTTLRYGLVLIAISLLLSIMVQYRSIGYKSVLEDTRRNTYTNSGIFDLTGSDLGSELFVIVKYYDKPLACSDYTECILFPFLDHDEQICIKPYSKKILAGQIS